MSYRGRLGWKRSYACSNRYQGSRSNGNCTFSFSFLPVRFVSLLLTFPLLPPLLLLPETSPIGSNVLQRRRGEDLHGEGTSPFPSPFLPFRAALFRRVSSLPSAVSEPKSLILLSLLFSFFLYLVVQEHAMHLRVLGIIKSRGVTVHDTSFRRKKVVIERCRKNSWRW